MTHRKLQKLQQELSYRQQVARQLRTQRSLGLGSWSLAWVLIQGLVFNSKSSFGRLPWAFWNIFLAGGLRKKC